MGRTRRSGPRPPLTRAEIQYDTLDRLRDLKNHKDEPIYSVINRSTTALEFHEDNRERLEKFPKRMVSIQTRLTENGTAVALFIEFMNPQQLQEYLNLNRNILSDDIISQIKKKLVAAAEIQQT